MGEINFHASLVQRTTTRRMQRDTVHAAPNSPSFSYWPHAAQQVQYLDGGVLANIGATPWMFARRSDGPPPTLKCGTGLRYSESAGWQCPTAPCYGQKPHDGARCDLMTGKWLVNTAGGQQPPFARTQVQMAPCQIDKSYPPAVGTLGIPQCDRLTGRFYYDLVDGVPGSYDYQGMSSVMSYREGRTGLPTGRGGLSAGTGIEYKNRRMDNGIALDRAYTGYHSKGVPFMDMQGLLHPAQTGVSNQEHRQRGQYQKNSSLLPTLRYYATPDPAGQRPLAGYIGTTRVGRDAHISNRTSKLTPQDAAAAEQIWMRPYQVLENDALIHRGGPN